MEGLRYKKKAWQFGEHVVNLKKTVDWINNNNIGFGGLRDKTKISHYNNVKKWVGNHYS